MNNSSSRSCEYMLALYNYMIHRFTGITVSTKFPNINKQITIKGGYNKHNIIDESYSRRHFKLAIAKSNTFIKKQTSNY